MEWESWKAEHSRMYRDKEEDQRRYSIWKENMDYIENHNRDAEKHGFVLKMNKFGDMVIKYCMQFKILMGERMIWSHVPVIAYVA